MIGARGAIAILLLSACAVAFLGSRATIAQVPVSASDVAQALRRFGFVSGQTVELRGRRVLESVIITDRGDGEFEVRFKLRPAH